MKILFTGGGGGHFYPIIAVAEGVWNIVKERKLISPKLYYYGPKPYDEEMLFKNEIEYRKVFSGKARKYFSILNFTDIFKTIFGVIRAIISIFFLFPDVIFCKGSYAAFPIVVAGRFFGIPVFVHESDTVPGRTNQWASRFAERIAVSYPEASEFFPKEKTAFTGNPVRKAIKILAKEGAHEFLNLESDIPVILVLGGSQGAQNINNVILEALPDLVENYQIIHQTGERHIESAKEIASIRLEGNEHDYRYKPFSHLEDVALRMSAGVADVIVSRAGSTIFEIALWGIPSIIIPITSSNGDHQRKNAFSYAKAGACVVMEEKNLKASILKSEINRLVNDEETKKEMSKSAKNFAKPDAAKKIAEELVNIALEHEK